MEERRQRSRTPLRFILTAILAASALWLVELYMQPTWPKIRSFLLGYFLGTFVMEWIRTRADRGAVTTTVASAPALDAGTAATNR
jgi:hypothetical protein